MVGAGGCPLAGSLWQEWSKRCYDSRKTRASISVSFDEAGVEMLGLDDASALATALVDDVEPRLPEILTEEDAKLQLIVRFLTEVLGWNHGDTHSGLTHLELALFNSVFFEQMALTALIANVDVARQIRSHYSLNEMFNMRMRRVRETFASFLLQEDEKFCRVPEASQYAVQKALSADVRKYSGGVSEAELSNRDAVAISARLGLVAKGVSGVVDWFDESKGYGFVIVGESGVSAFLHASVLERSGIDSVHDGDALIVDVSRSHKGVAISEVRKAQPNEVAGAALVDAVVVKFFADRGYGFVYVPTLGKDAFFHASLLPEQDRASVAIGNVSKQRLTRIQRVEDYKSDAFREKVLKGVRQVEATARIVG
jgi:CspA family cold shock protein